MLLEVFLTPGQNPLEGPSIVSGLGTPWNPPGGAGECHQGEGSPPSPFDLHLDEQLNITGLIKVVFVFIFLFTVSLCSLLQS